MAKGPRKPSGKSGKIENDSTAPCTHRQQNPTTGTASVSKSISMVEPKYYKDNVTLKIQVKETERKLCTLYLGESASLAAVKEEIVRKNKAVILKNLFIKEEQCRSRIIKLFIKDSESDGDDTVTLKDLGMKNGESHSMMVSFVRALAFLTQRQINNMVTNVETQTEGRYPQELIVQAINMAPECKLEQTISNLLNNAVRVFESILQSECPQVIAEVRAIREQNIYPTCRIRYQIIGEQYRQMVLETFRMTLPNVYNHLCKRTFFCDYLLQTGIFTNAELDDQHRQLYDRIM